jgi:alanine dehydrogenase
MRPWGSPVVTVTLGMLIGVSELLVLSGDDVRAVLEAVDLRAALADAFTASSAGDASVPPRSSTQTPAGLLLTMPGFVPSAGLGVKAVSVFTDNRDRPTHQGVMVMFDPTTGTPIAMLDAASLTDARTAAAAAIAADLCVPAHASVLAIIGAGALGRAHLDAFASLRGWSEVRVASRTHAHAVALEATQLQRVRAVASFEEAVRDADAVCLCTDAPSPIINAAWIRAGAHISAVGRGAEVPDEVVDAALANRRLLVEWRGAASHPPPAGAPELQRVDPMLVIELGDALAGREAIGATGTSLYTSTGHAIEDLAAASAVLDTARRLGRGVTVDL